MNFVQPDPIGIGRKHPVELIPCERVPRKEVILVENPTLDLKTEAEETVKGALGGNLHKRSR